MLSIILANIANIVYGLLLADSIDGAGFEKYQGSCIWYQF
jgi:hypothetical protein